MASARVKFEGLEALRGRIAAAASPDFVTGLGQVLGAAALKQLADEFRHERDPYGNPWAPLALRRGRILRDTGRMAASAAVTGRSGGFELAITAKYASTHQRGATIRPTRARRLRFTVDGRTYWARKVTIPRRQMLPEAATGGWGELWMGAFRKEAKAYQARHFRGGGR